MPIVDGVLNVAIFLAILVVLVVVHELGHFVTARLARVRVHEFGIGFPPRAKVIGRDRETIYTLNWLPIGGFVRLEGEEGESEDPRAFVNQSLRTRLVILLAGVFMNFVLAWLIFSFIAGAADPTTAVRIGAVTPGSPAERAGLVGGRQLGENAFDASGDVILAIDGIRFPRFENMGDQDVAPLRYLRERAGQTVTLTVRRGDGRVEDIAAALRRPEELSENVGALGIRPSAFPVGDDIQRSPVDAVAVGWSRTLDASTLVLRGLAQLVTNLANPPVVGPIGIASVVGAARSPEVPPIFLLWLVGLLSANLAVVNVLPFPPMDGGRIAVAVVQAISGNRISVAVERAVYLTGFVLLMALIVWISFFDIQRLRDLT